MKVKITASLYNGEELSENEFVQDFYLDNKNYGPEIVNWIRAIKKDPSKKSGSVVSDFLNLVERTSLSKWASGKLKPDSNVVLKWKVLKAIGWKG